MRVSAILAGSLLLTGCAETAVGPEGGGAASVAEIVCEADGSTTVLTPTVVVQPDGIHVRVVSHLDEPAEIIGLGHDVDPGETRWVSHAPPGTAETACNPFSQHGSGEVPTTKPIEIVDPDGLYLEGGLECGFLSSEWGMTGDFAEAPLEEGVVPLSEARASIDGVEPQDEVRYAGYPSSRDRNVVVVRDGDVIASFEFVTFDGEEWVAASASGCDGSGIHSSF
jgi:hypothetical protein